MSGSYVEVVPPGRTVHIENFEEDWASDPTTVTTLFTEAGGVTTVSMTIRFSSMDARDGARATGMTDGMEAGYARLDAILPELA